jgi:predicted Zn-dependent protease with MMP-like domain
MKSFSIVSATTNSAAIDLPDIADFYVLAQKTLESLPERFERTTKSLIVKVENYADHETLLSLNLDDKYDLLGLYRGIPVPTKSTKSSFLIPDIIYLYRCPLIRYSLENQEALESLVNHVMIHEIGHHFGFNDYDLSWSEQR